MSLRLKALALLPLLALAPAIAAQADESGLEHFEAKVRPILVDRCYECHSDLKSKRRGGLVLDSRGGWEKGGDTGPALVPGDPDESLLIQAVRYTDPDLQMPPRAKLAEDEIQALETWVKNGAFDPRGAEAAQPAEAAAAPTPVRDLAEARRFWSLVPPNRPPLPELRSPARARTPIDAFIFSALETRRIEAAPEVGRATLLRRIAFDLTGLPPTEAECRDFEADTSPDALDRRIDGYLASPHYGERQARAWLDLARYADSNGLDENLAMSEAWRWRDWVVRAFNADLPYDRFLTLQLAGDLLPEPEDREALRDQLTATGFLVLGPKMLAEQDKEKLKIDVVDEQMDVAGKAFLGLSFGCARCHDHKFDPISQKDYYALAGIFRSTRSLANTDFVSRWNERVVATAAERAADAAHAEALRAIEARREATLKAESARVAGEALSRSADYLLAGIRAAEAAITIEAEEASRTNLKVDDSNWGSKDSPILHTGAAGLQYAEYDLSLAQAGLYRLEVRMASAEERPMRLLVDGETRSEAVLGDKTGGFHAPDLRWRPVATLALRAGRNLIRLERSGAVPHLDKLRFVAADEGRPAWPAVDEGSGLSPLLVAETADWLETRARRGDPLFSLFAELSALGDEDFAARAAARIGTRLAAGPSPALRVLLEGPRPTRLSDFAARIQTLIASADLALRGRREQEKTLVRLGDPVLDQVIGLLAGEVPPLAPPADLAREALDPAAKRRLDELDAERDRQLAKSPPMRERVLGVEDGEIHELPVHVRGSHLSLADTAETRRMPEVFDGICAAPAIPAKASGRLELAAWLTEPDHPLTARVMVNRIWQAHFGRGLVESPSNFGRRGDLPSHLELLDWLAREFIESGWSIKHIHRLILRSAVYALSADETPAAAAADPENRLHHRSARRRLDADQIRDAILAVSGHLDPTVGGTLLTVNDGAYVTNDQSGNAARYDQPRRSLYLPIIRNAIFDYFAAFDFGDASTPLEKRASSVAPHQALFLMNSPFVLGEAERIAKELPAGDTAARIEALHRRILLRGARPDEVARIRDYLAAEGQTPDDLRAWQGLAQVLLSSNEFLHLD